jgi:hypothetical protein
MKTIYKAIVERLEPMLEDNTIRWIDWDKGQLKKISDKNRPPVNYPCALIRISVAKKTDITDTIQDCVATVTITLAFDPALYMRSSANAPEDVREKALEPYEVIADIYKRLQGYNTPNFDYLTRKSQGEVTHNNLFVYQIVFECEFEDYTEED